MSSLATLAAPSTPLTEIPCLVLPNVVDLRETNRVFLTLYNPFKAPLNFAVLCTSTSQFLIVPVKGSVPRQSSIVITVKRHAVQKQEHCPQRESDEKKAEHRITSGHALRIELRDVVGEVIGKQEIDILTGASPNTVIRPDVSVFSWTNAAQSLVELNRHRPQLRSQSRRSRSKSRQRDLNMDAPSFFNLGHVIDVTFTCTTRMLPLVAGCTLLHLMLSNELDVPTDPQARIWLAFAIGLVTAFVQCKVMDGK